MNEYEADREKMERYRDDFAGYNRIRKSILRTYFRLYHRLEVSGLENIPEGPALIATNHGGGLDLDILALSYFCHPTREIHSLIASDWHYLNSGWGRYWVGGGIPLWTHGGIRYEYIDPYLREGGEHFPGLAAIYPEGHSGTFKTRHVLGKFYPGVVRIALKYRVPIVPVAMTGFHGASPILWEIERDHGPNDIVCPPFAFPAKLRADFGEAFELEQYYGVELTKAEEFAVANEVVRPRLAELLGRREKVILEDAGV